MRKKLDGMDKAELRKLIYEKTGYTLASNSILSQVFRRSSYCAEQGGMSNEMFEFLGDQILSYYAVKIVAQRCCAVNLEGDWTFRIRQNRFSVLKQELLSNAAFAQIIDDWGVADYLIVGKDDEKNDVSKQIKVKADLFEAIIGGIAVACKWDPIVMEAVVSKALGMDARIDAILQSDPCAMLFDIDNAVTKLKELAEKEQCSQPAYSFMGPDDLGYDKDGNPIWSCNCCAVNDKTGMLVSVFASSKKEAKKAAAYLILCQHFEAPNRYGITKMGGVWTYKNGTLMPDSSEPAKR